NICGGYYYDEEYCPMSECECEREKLHRKPFYGPFFTRMPTSKEVSDTMQWSTYDTEPFDPTSRYSFRNCLEGFMQPSDGVTRALAMHNYVHVAMGGTMSEVPIACNDPFFLLHHAFIDKIFYRWILSFNVQPKDYPACDKIGHRPNDYMVPFFPFYKQRDMLTTFDFGAVYSTYKNF
ncbi:hypothetical protein FKM82_018366, partial [Ascaphus truei]